MSPADNKRFQAVVAKNVSVGMAFDVALEHLAKAGFACDTQHYGSEALCRKRKYGFLYTCEQHVQLAFDSSRQVVQSVDPIPILCASM